MRTSRWPGGADLDSEVQPTEAAAVEPRQGDAKRVATVGSGASCWFAACSGKSKSASKATTSAAATSTSMSMPALTSTTAAAFTATSTRVTPPTSAILAQPALCTTGQLTITIAGIQGGLSHAGEVIPFKNTGNAFQLHGTLVSTA